ncbi:MAG: hypothetical protein U0572_00925 [Phycisphaerales bacterium]
MPQNSGHLLGTASRRRLALASSLAAAAAIPCGVSADVVSDFYYNSEIYNYKITHMPDLDQYRASLPALGSMYCVPTSAINIFAYAANHGFPNVNPGPANWQSQSNYTEANLWIWSMGAFMGTDPIEGTTGGAGAGLDAFLETEPLLKRISKYRNSQYTPTVAKLTKLGCQGWAMSFLYGKYEVTGTSGDFKILSRVGGHAITLTRSYRAGDTRILRYRDPADDPDALSSQSTFVNKERDPYEYTAYFGSASVDNLRSMTVIFSSGGVRRIIDTFHGIRPLYGISFTNGSDSTGGGSVEILDPIPFDGSPSASRSAISISSALDVLDFAFDADFEGALVIAKSNILSLPSRLRTLDLDTGALTILSPAPQGLVKLATDRHGRTYSFDTLGKLYQLAADGSVLNATSAVPQPTDVAVNDVDDSVWILSVPDRKVVKLSEDFSETLLTISVPILVPMSGDGLLTISPITGLPWFKTAANDKLYGLSVAASGAPIVTTFTSSSLTNASSVSIGDSGELFISGNGTIKVLKPVRIGLWATDATHPFNGLPGGTYLAMLHNSSNFDPILHTGPGWQNLSYAEIQDDAPVVSDCLADVNADEVIDAGDLAILLGAWGTADGISDIDEDGIVGASDLAVLLGAWGPCGG